MTTVGLTQLRRHLSKYLAMVKAGEELLITERGIPVARIVPIADTEREQIERTLGKEREDK